MHDKAQTDGRPCWVHQNSSLISPFVEKLLGEDPSLMQPWLVSN